jgi:hypothetical protein
VFIGADSDRRRAGRDGGGDGDEVKFQTVVDKNAGFPFPVTYFGLFLTVGWGNRQACTVIHELGITRTREYETIDLFGDSRIIGGSLRWLSIQHYQPNRRMALRPWKWKFKWSRRLDGNYLL